MDRQLGKCNLAKWRILAIIFILITIKILLSIFIFKKLDGFPLIHGDDCSKILMSWGCRDNLKWALYNDMWLPLHAWILALGLKIFPNTLAAPVIVNTIFSIGSLIALFFVTYELFNKSIPVAALTVILVTFHPFFARLSLSGLEMPIFHFFIVMGIYSWIRYKNCKKIIFLLCSTAVFLLSTAIRYEGWIFTLIYSFLILRELIDKEKGHKYYLIGSLIASYLFIFFWIFWQRVHFGSPFFFIIRQYNTGINEASNWNKYGLSSFGIMTGILKSIFYFFSWPLIISSIIGLWLAFKFYKNKSQIFDFLIFVTAGFIILLILFYLKLGGSWPNKQYAIILLLLLPLCSLGIWQGTILQFRNRNLSVILLLMVAVLLWFKAYDRGGYYFSEQRSNYYARKMAVLLNSLQLKSISKVLLEVRTFADNEDTYLYDPFFILVVKPDSIIPDRKMKYIIKDSQEHLDINNNPSVFDSTLEELVTYLKNNRVEIVLCIYEDTKRRLDEVMKHITTIGSYSIYTWPDENSLIDKIKAYSAMSTK